MMRSLFYIFFLNYVFADETSRLVQTPQGPIRGYKDFDNNIFTFYNIPYATAPTGENRFKAPGPAPTWTELFEAVDKEIVCHQSDYLHTLIRSKKMEENCLIATVYVPDTNDSDLPVYVYVHGGGYAFGFGDLVTPKKLVSSKKIIAVTFNYRLGPHGFLCLGTEDVPGNAGMKDQVALLRWVKKNIASFGGNPNDVTIGGGSAGSSSVDLLILSKMAEGLFNKVIPESGASTAAFSIQSDPIENAKEYAKLLNVENIKDIIELERFFKTVSYENMFTNKIVNRTDSNFLMSPCVERNIGREIFLEDSPINILKSGNYKKLPMLYGFANMEGLMRIELFDAWKNEMENNFEIFLASDLKFNSEGEKTRVAKEIKKFYFDDESVCDNILSYINYFSDVLFTYSTLKSTKLQVEAGNDQIYLYEFSYVNENTPDVPNTDIRGATHCAQSLAVMDGLNFTTFYSIPYSEEYETVRQIYREVWLNFIVYGNPTPDNSNLPQWLPVGADLSPHMSLNKTMKLKGSLLKERMEFWEEIYDKYYRNPVPPYSPAAHSEL